MELRITKNPYPRIKTAYFSILTIAYFSSATSDGMSSINIRESVQC